MYLPTLWLGGEPLTILSVSHTESNMAIRPNSKLRLEVVFLTFRTYICFK